MIPIECSKKKWSKREKKELKKVSKINSKKRKFTIELDKRID